ncbi:Fe2+-dependent dioxygenase [Microcoleus sp. herbarium14]|uniref:Fe2+-dependent dioxygenase n=1 Tax=Microcoleus sp. herbarium14 TaxID=3055439 RepID=UPI002FD08E1D
MHIPKILEPDEVETIISFLSQHELIDGKISAGYSAKFVKENLQLSKETGNKNYIDTIVIEGLNRNESVRKAIFPLKIAPPIFSKYESGMHYGNHVDNPLISREPRLRTDVSLTIFLSDPNSYDGGELTVDMGAGTLQFKLPCGDAIVYPTSNIHRVEPVTRGTRLAAVTWIQSAVRNSSHREILYETNLVRVSLINSSPNSQESILISKTYSNLVRMWADI